MISRIFGSSDYSEKGFSLIEMMISLAIVGVLATVVIPKFAYMQVKARQSEAKAALGAIFMTEQAFAAQFSSYTGCLAEAGYLPTGTIGNSHNGYYAQGFKQSVVVGVTCGPGGLYMCSVTDYDAAIGSKTCNGSSGQYTYIDHRDRK